MFANFAGHEFNDETQCLAHEKVMHKCPICSHNYYLFGSEQRCDLGTTNCKFQQKEDT